MCEYSNSADKGLSHLQSHLSNSSGVDDALAHLSKGTGDRYACMGALQSNATANAMAAWFSAGSINVMKQWAYVAAKIRRAMYQLKPDGYFHGYEHLTPLLSDHDALISWFANFEVPFSEKGFYSNPARAARPNTPDFTSYQVLLALRGNWTELERRSNLFLAEMPKTRKSYVADQRFHLALAHGDVSAMEVALAEMLDPAVMRRRREKDESGYTQWFISTYAVIYSKIAWRHGYQVEVDSLWVPKEWLPVAPLPCYEDPYPFLQELDINTPIEI